MEKLINFKGPSVLSQRSIMNTPAYQMDDAQQLFPDDIQLSVRRASNGYIINAYGYKAGQHFSEQFVTQSERGVSALVEQLLTEFKEAVNGSVS